MIKYKNLVHSIEKSPLIYDKNINKKSKRHVFTPTSIHSNVADGQIKIKFNLENIKSLEKQKTQLLVKNQITDEHLPSETSSIKSLRLEDDII